MHISCIPSRIDQLYLLLAQVFISIRVTLDLKHDLMFGVLISAHDSLNDSALGHASCVEFLFLDKQIMHYSITVYLELFLFTLLSAHKGLSAIE